jgi:hypothetical protein
VCRADALSNLCWNFVDQSMKIHNGWLANGVTVGAHLLRNGVHGLDRSLPEKIVVKYFIF